MTLLLFLRGRAEGAGERHSRINLKPASSGFSCLGLVRLVEFCGWEASGCLPFGGSQRDRGLVVGGLARAKRESKCWGCWGLR